MKQSQSSKSKAAQEESCSSYEINKLYSEGFKYDENDIYEEEEFSPKEESKKYSKRH